MVQLSRLRDEWLPITVALILSTLLTIACTALVMNLMRRLTQGRSVTPRFTDILVYLHDPAAGPDGHAGLSRRVLIYKARTSIRC
jgi:hypothetical protein